MTKFTIAKSDGGVLEVAALTAVDAVRIACEVYLLDESELVSISDGVVTERFNPDDLVGKGS